jgi:hypothetical protein
VSSSSVIVLFVYVALDFFEFGQKIVKKNPPLFRNWHGPVAEISLTRPEDVEVSGCLLTINECINILVEEVSQNF